MCVDYAATDNRFTQIDAFPMSDIQELLSEICGKCVFSKIDIKDAYHGLLIPAEEKKKYHSLRSRWETLQIYADAFRSDNWNSWIWKSHATSYRRFE